MAQNKKKNPLNFTGLDYDTIRTQIQNAVDRDPRFETFRDSSIAQTVLDLFAATTDLSNYYIERRAEEQFLETARLRSSIIGLSRLLGYVPRRPVPAEAGITIVLKGPLPASLTAGETVSFVKATGENFARFTGSDFPFMLKHTYTYEFTSDDITGGVGNPEWSKEISYGISQSADDAPIPLDVNGSVDTRLLERIKVLQGEFKTETVYGTSNSQVGQLFQKYKVADEDFSNYYGEEDWGYNDITESENLDNNLTWLGIGSNVDQASNNRFSIKRRSLIDPNQLTPDDSEIPKVVLILTNIDETVTIYFGDDNFSSKGLESNTKNIYVRYVATKGTEANRVGVTGDEMTSPNTYLSDQNNIDLTSNISFKFSTNIANGADLENEESIRLNSPQIYYSLDRLVTRRDYIQWLKTQTLGTTGAQINNAIAWGEQEEVARRGQNANFRFFNVIFFSVLGEIYSLPPNGTYFPLNENQIHDAYLEEEEDFSTIVDTTSGVVSADGYPEQAYFNIFVKELPQPEVQRVNEFREIDGEHPISLMYTKIDKRAQSTVRQIYVSPIVQRFQLTGRVTIGKLEDRVTVRKKINNNIYDWLNDNADFAVNIQKSNITELIEIEPEVVSSNIRIEPIIPDRLITTFEEDVDFTGGTDVSTSAEVLTAYQNAINSYLTSAGFAHVCSPNTSGTSAMLSIYDVPELSASTQPLSASTLPTSGSTVPGIWNNPYSTNAFPDYWYEYRAHLRSGYVNEYTFYNDLIGTVYDELVTAGTLTPSGQLFVESQYFKNITYKLHNDIVGFIRTNMLDAEGNISEYSLDAEIAQLDLSTLSYQFE